MLCTRFSHLTHRPYGAWHRATHRRHHHLLVRVPVHHLLLFLFIQRIITHLIRILFLRQIGCFLLEISIIRDVVTTVHIIWRNLAVDAWLLGECLLIEVVDLWRRHLLFTERWRSPSLHHWWLRHLLHLLRHLLLHHLLLRHHWSLHHIHIGPLHHGLSHPWLHLLTRGNLLWWHPLLLRVGRPLLHLHHAGIGTGLLHIAHHAWIIWSLLQLVHHAWIGLLELIVHHGLIRRGLLVLAHHLRVVLLLRHHHLRWVSI